MPAAKETDASRARESRWERAVADHVAGRLAAAEPVYQDLLREEPHDAAALHMLGMLLYQRGEGAAGLTLVEEAIGIDGGTARYHGHRGLILAGLGRSRDAIAACRRALELNPRMPEVQNNLGGLLQTAGDTWEAIAAYRAALAERPGMVEAAMNLGLALMKGEAYAEAVEVLKNALAMRAGDPALRDHLATALNNYGVSLEQAGQSEKALAAFEEAMGVDGGSAEVFFNLAKSLTSLMRHEEAIAAYGEAIARKPDFSEAHNNLGIVLFLRGRLVEAIGSYEAALRHAPEYALALNNLGNALRAQGRIDEAIQRYRDALERVPGNAEVWNNLGSALDAQGDLAAALADCDQAIALQPAFSQAHNNRANTLKNLGDVGAALRAYDRAIELDPSNEEVQSNRLYTLYFDAQATGDSLYREHAAWNVQHAARFLPASTPAPAERPVGRRLRIGYVGAAFREHCQSFFTVPLFSNHDADQFEIIGYSDTVMQDALTRRLRGCCAAWREIGGMADEEVAKMVRRDGVDVLVDLSVHMSQNRLLMFARKPAPVQVTWLGYPGTTGLTAMDYRLTDPFLDPPTSGEAAGADQLYSERSWRLPRTFWCYDPLTEGLISPAVNESPLMRNGYVTFGCLNNFCKVNEGVLQLWSAVMREVKSSRLVLLAPRAAQARVLKNFADCGVSKERIEFVERASRLKYLAMYQRIDIGLDTFPYNGHTTTLDALWMGVPVVTLVGNSPVGRGGWSQLNNIGLQELAAEAAEGFVRIAGNLAGDTERVRAIRSSLRERMRSSPLMDGAAFARGIEEAYRAFCEGSPAERSAGRGS